MQDSQSTPSKPMRVGHRSSVVITVVYATGRSSRWTTSRTLLSPRAQRICIRSNSRRPSDNCWTAWLGCAIRFLRKRIIFRKPLSARRHRLAVASNGKRHSTLFSREVEILDLRAEKTNRATLGGGPVCCKPATTIATKRKANTRLISETCGRWPELQRTQSKFVADAPGNDCQTGGRCDESERPPG